MSPRFLLTSLLMEFDADQVRFFLLFIPHMLFALTLHEFCHAGAAYLKGDDTAALQGRLTLNPLPHIDPLGLLAFFIVKFGWAKPVPVNPLRLKNPKRDMMLVGLAGPGSNLALGLILLFLTRGIVTFAGPEDKAADMLARFLFIGAQLNVGLFFFNLIPVPPLDGGHILMGILPASLETKFEPVLAKGPMIFLGLIVLSFVFRLPIFDYLVWTPVKFISNLVLG